MVVRVFFHFPVRRFILIVILLTIAPTVGGRGRRIGGSVGRMAFRRFHPRRRWLLGFQHTLLVPVGNLYFTSHLLPDFIHILILLFLHPSVILSFYLQVNRATRRQVLHVLSPFHQLHQNLIRLFPSVMIILQKYFSIIISGFHSRHIIHAVYRHCHIRIDLHLHRAIRHQKIVPAPYDQKTKARRRGEESDNFLFAHPMSLFPIAQDILCGLPHLIIHIGNSQETAIFIQRDGISLMTLHNQIFHCSSPPFPLICFK